MNKQEIIAILRSAPSRDIKFPVEPKPVKHPTVVWLEAQGLAYNDSEDGTIVINDDIYLDHQDLYELPVDFSMCVVHGEFSLTFNNLKNLKGCPKVVNGSLYVYQNKLESLEGCPKVVTGKFSCMENRLKNLKHIPKGCFEYFTDFEYIKKYSDIPKELL